MVSHRHRRTVLTVLSLYIFAAAFVFRPFLFFPSTLLFLAGGLAFGIVWGTLYATTGATLGAIVGFYKSPAGAKFIAVQPVVMRQAIGIGQRWGQEIGREIEAEARRELKRRGIDL